MMLLTKRLELSPSGGRELLCKLNYDLLNEIYGNRLVVYELSTGRLKEVIPILDAFKGNIDGLNSTTINDALNTIKAKTVSKIFVDGSNLGAFVKVLKQTIPQVEVTTFFHNVEARFFVGSLRVQKSLRALAVLIVNYLAERKAVRYSDKIICLNERDSILLNKIYGRGATHISPMALEDKLPPGHADQISPSDEKFALFVGGTFYANRVGIAWFVREVAPRIDMKVCIVGRGFEQLRDELEIPGKVEVVGAVDSLAEWYRRAQFVIAPIFDGSGMKTKVAEALMYGKKIVGTPEAFAGYEEISYHVGYVCATADEFVAAIEWIRTEDVKPFDPELRALYEKWHSYPAARDRLAEILCSGECSRLKSEIGI